MTSDSRGDARASGRGQRRRAVVRDALAGLGGLAAGRLVPGLVPSARSPTAVVTPDPIPARIARGERAVEIAEFATLPPSSTSLPKTRLNQLGHAGDESAVTGGFVYRGSAVPALRGYYLMGDIVTGRIYYVAVASLRQGAQAQLRELNLRRNGRPVTLTGLLGHPRADLRLGQDEAGEICVLSKRDGGIRKLAPA